MCVGDVHARGDVVAIGSRSTVRAWDDESVIKVPNESTPVAWIHHEAHYTAAVWALGVPTHRPTGLVVHEGRPSSVYERLDGPTMWSLILSAPHLAEHHGRSLAQLHVRLLSVTPPVSLPRKSDRLRCKLRRAAAVSHPGLGDVSLDLPPASGAPSLCHGDFHPGNVIVTADGPMIVDWFDACRGEAAGDIARTSLLLGVGGASSEELRHLPGATPGVLAALHDAYLRTVTSLLSIDPATVARWRRIEALARVAEGIDPAAMAGVVATAPADQLPSAAQPWRLLGR